MARFTIALLGIILPLILIFSVFTGCEKDQDDPEINWPAEIESTKADYINSTYAYFEADLSGEILDITATGFCWSTNDTPTIDDNSISMNPEPGIYSHTVSALTSGTTYYLRAYYTFEDQTYYGEQITFTTTEPLTDNDGNSYEVVQIGNQLWTKENMKVLTYNNNDSIADGTGIGNYSEMSTPRFYFNYEDEQANHETYGNLYTWYTITDPRGFCPDGWRVPDIVDWETMIKHLDALASKFESPSQGSIEISAIAGGMLRETGTVENQNGLWHQPNTGANNITRMSVLPSGMRDPSGAFDGLGYNAAFWTFTEDSSNQAIMFYTHYFNPGIYANTFSKSSGYAVRCVTDVP